MARMSWKEACKLDPTLQGLTHFFSFPPEYAQTLTGGLTNRCWKVVCSQGKAYVWRPTTLITKAFSISRYQEYQILKAIQSSQLSPAAMLVNEWGLLVEWIEGDSLTDKPSFDGLLRMQARIHELAINHIPVVPFSFTARVDHYWMQIKPELKTEQVRALYEDWRNPPNLAEVAQCLCHFDLAGYNMVKTESGYKVIDWEYAGIADPRLDLALSINVAGEKILDAVFRYCQLREIEDVDKWVSGVKAWLPRTNMMALLWYLLAYQLWGDEEYYRQACHLQETFC
ncbi:MULTISPECIES: phosphotransferase [Vibrio]|uniref:Phosphotransferase n=1 Tax=Vibrio ostreae TaxID=2841925 RepID=A0A975YPS4_9VIBR|nr:MULTISPECIES: phosphotransferase [Vibrio]QXO19098.1 phosphotransferase [Vibrio ostreae]WGY46553.1 phosphotransferase [Vibrio sp. ABG19]